MESNVGPSAICRGLKGNKKASEKVVESIVNVLPYEYGKYCLSMRLLIKECWTIYHDNTGQWTNKNKIDILKLLTGAIRTGFELSEQSLVNLYAQQLYQDVKDLI